MVASTGSTEEPSPRRPGRGRLAAAVLVGLIVAGCILQLALSLRDTGGYGAEVGTQPSFCVPAATARALGLGDGVLCPPPGPSRPGS